MKIINFNRIYINLQNNIIKIKFDYETSMFIYIQYKNIYMHIVT
jgi:hypothetical protein